MKKVLFTLAAMAFGLIASAQDKPAPVLAFADQDENLIEEVSLAPGEQATVKVILTEQQEVVVMGFQMQWKTYNAAHEVTTDVICPSVIPDDPDFPMEYNWAAPLGLSTASAANGGVPGNALGFANPEPGVWRWVGTNTSRNQFWWPRGNFMPPIAVGMIAIQAPAEWTEEFATFELDLDYTLYNQTYETTPASQLNYEARPTAPMVLKLKNTAFVPPVENVDLSGQIEIGEPTEDGMLAISYNGNEAGVTLTVTINGEEVDIVDGMVQLLEGENEIVVVAGGDGYNDLTETFTVTWAPQPPVQTPAPVINIIPGEEAYTIEAVGEGTIHLFIDEQEVENPYTIARTDVDQVIKVTAVAHVDGQIDGTVSGEYMIPALEVIPPEPEVTPQPEITYEVTDDAVIITATGEGTVLLYINGELVDNPCTIDRGTEDVTIVATATAQGEDMLISDEVSMEITIPAVAETPEDPEGHNTGYWVVFIDKNGEPVWYKLTTGADNDGLQTNVALTYSEFGGFDFFGGEDRPYVEFYFVIDGERFACEEDQTEPFYGDANENPLFSNENYWVVPVGYKYVVGVVTDSETGKHYVQISKGIFVGVDELNADKTVAGVRYFNMAGQEMQEVNGMTIVVTTYTDGTTSAVKVMK